RGGGRGRGGNRRDDRAREPRRRDRRESDLRPGDFEQHYEPVAVPEQGPESEAATAVREWCEEVIDYARFELDVRTEENEQQIVVRLYGRDARRMIEEHGEALDALQVLANKALVGRKTEKDIELDCEGFKSRRHEELEQRARDAADRVRSEGREQLLPAMTPIERRIVHLALQDDADVTTESRGEGFYKRVAIVRRAAEQ
ncbi:MAG TPA: R3H domain-containing nucleic acid-binding protein, partial [Thermoanaerobaculia bacterium]|nr:R3H domain-containing nucleic acid-binding protein [Thermoanaerobaculia bacterium]